MSTGTPTPAIRALLAISRHTPLGRGQLRREVTKVIERWHQGPIDTTFRGVPIRLNLDNTTERKALFGNYDTRELDFIAAAVKTSGSVFIDVGANSGLYTVYVGSQIGPQSRIIAIEPNGAMCERIKHNLDLTAAQRKARNVASSVVQCAVGAQAGDAFLDLRDGLGRAHISQSQSTRSLAVQIRPLIDILREQKLDKIDALKIDIEGYEDQALEPFFGTADRSLFPKAIVIEHSHRAKWDTDVIAMCETLGYRQRGRTRGNLLLALR